MLTYVCVIVIDFQAHRDAFIQNSISILGVWVNHVIIFKSITLYYQKQNHECPVLGKHPLPLPGIETRFTRCPGLRLGTIPTALGTAGWGFSLRSRFSERQMGGGLLGHVTLWCSESMPAFRCNVVLASLDRNHF